MLAYLGNKEPVDGIKLFKPMKQKNLKGKSKFIP